MTQPTAEAAVHRFAGWELHPQERLLLVRGEPVKVGSRAFDLLRVLAERAGRVVSKGELLDLAWPGLVVEENNLSVQITTLRKLLGAGAIANVAGIGYRLAAVPAAGAGSAVGDTRPRPALPAPVLYGRDADLQALLPLLDGSPLVSIVGTGGVGKTTLARAVMARTTLAPADGLHWIDLAPLRPGERLLPLVAKTLGVLTDGAADDAGGLVRALSGLQALVVLDNCEHLLDEVAGPLGRLLQHAPGLRWLTTSHEPLHLHGETVYRLGPLDVPAPGAAAQDALHSGALALFLERARAADRRFELTAERIDTAVELCRQLDGLPLALEMAAARVATLGLQGVHDQIDRRLRLRASLRDAPARHHTLQQTYEWSYGLLTPTEQCVFRRLEPFAGGFTAQMAQQLCCGIDGPGGPLDTWAMLDALSALVDKSLVQRGAAPEDGGQERLHLLESARDYARLQLELAGELQATRRQHAQVVAMAFASAQHELEQWRDRDWATKYLPERLNVCAALAWACAHGEPEVLARLVAALARMDAFAWAQAEIVNYAIPLHRLAEAPPPLRARAYLELGWAHFLDGNRETGTTLSLQALADFEARQDAVGTYEALTKLIRLYAGRPGLGERAQALWARLAAMDDSGIPLRTRLYCQSTVALPEGCPDAVPRLQALQRTAELAGFEAQVSACQANITNHLLLDGRFEAAAQLGQAALQAHPRRLRTRAMLCHNRALALVRLGRLNEARESARATLRAFPGAAHMVIDLMALAAVHEGAHERAALMAGWSERYKRERDRESEAAEAAVIADTHRLVAQHLGAKTAASLMQAGAAMSLAEVLNIALPA